MTLDRLNELTDVVLIDTINDFMHEQDLGATTRKLFVELIQRVDEGRSELVAENETLSNKIGDLEREITVLQPTVRKEAALQKILDRVVSDLASMAAK